MAAADYVEYAFYRGEELLYMGTAREIAEQHGVKRHTIYYYASPAYKKRLEKRKDPNRCISVVRLDD